MIQVDLRPIVIIDIYNYYGRSKRWVKYIKKIRKILITLFFFLLAGLCEIGGGYLVWQWLREKKGILIGLTGGIILFLYGMIPTFQPSHFGRTYAA